MQKLISIDLKADFGFFRKPEINDGINLSYNMIHKPSILGILGAIIGLEGYKEYGKLPDYIDKLGNIKIGIEPLQHEKGNFLKVIIKYSNTVGYANKGSNYLTEEVTLIRPAYRCYVLLDMDDEIHSKLYQHLKDGKAEYIPYFGKNEFFAWWENFNDTYTIESISTLENFRIVSLVCLDDEQTKSVEKAFAHNLVNSRTSHLQEYGYLYFERLPVSLEASDSALEKDKKARYSYGAQKKFVFSNILFDGSNRLDISLIKIAPGIAIQVF